MGKDKSHRSSLKMAAVIRKKAKAKRQHDKKELKNKQFPKRSKKVLPAPSKLPNREELEAQVREGSAFINDVIRAIESTRTEKKGSLDTQIDEMQRLIVEKHKERVHQAQASYSALMEALEQADLVVEVVDARDPSACRLLEAEGTVIEKKPLIIVLNKIDLVPRESTVRWLGVLRQTAPTVAVSALNESALPAIQEIVMNVAPQAKKAAVIGIRGVGKSTIVQMNTGLFREVPSYQFLVPNAEMGLLKGADYLDPEYDLALETMERVQDESLFVTLEMTAKEDPDEVLNELGKRWQIRPRLAAKKFLSNIWCGDTKFYAVPDDTEPGAISPVQDAALAPSVPYDMAAVEYIRLAAGQPLTIDEETLSITEEELEGHKGEEEKKD